MLGAHTDLTPLKKVEAVLEERTADLERSNKELEQFAYVASHDLQEPLRMVTGFLGLLERRLGSRIGEEERELFDFAKDGASRMQGMIEDLLAYSRVGTKGHPFESVESEKALALALANLETTIAEAEADVSHDSLPCVLGDEQQLIQLFQNLIGNAVKYGGDGPVRVHVGSEDEGADHVFSVQDNGIGIEPPAHDRIFQIFQRLHTREEFSGSGIGLSICQKIVERHGGRIWVESQPGKGSTFKFTIPRVES